MKKQRLPMPKPGYAITPKTAYDKKENKKTVEREVQDYVDGED